MTPGARFRDLHRSGTWVLVNVHDAGAAVVAEQAGAVALGTTSSGLAHTLARRDGIGAVGRDEAIAAAARICAAVSIPVSVDAENGWGHTPEEVARTITDLAEVGAAGASIEDWSGDPGIGLYERSLAVERVHAAVEAAAALPEPFVLCARAEGFLYGVADPLPHVLDRLRAFAEVGAGCLYAPGPSDRETLAAIVEGAGGPVNVLLQMGGDLTVADAAALGARRVSLGGSLYRALVAELDRLVRQVVADGVLDVATPPIPSADLEAALPPDPRGR